MATASSRAVVRPGDVTALAVLVLTAGVGVAFYSVLPAELVVGWHLGLDGEVVTTHGPRAVGAFVVPAVATLVFAVGRGVTLLPGVAAALREHRTAYDAALTLALVGLCAVQVVLVAANV